MADKKPSGGHKKGLLTREQLSDIAPAVELLADSTAHLFAYTRIEDRLALSSKRRQLLDADERTQAVVRAFYSLTPQGVGETQAGLLRKLSSYGKMTLNSVFGRDLYDMTPFEPASGDFPAQDSMVISAISELQKSIACIDHYLPPQQEQARGR